MGIQWTLALRYLGGRKLRAFLTTLAVVFGVVVIFGMNSLIPTIMQAFQSTMLAGSNKVDLTVTQRTNEPFSASLLDQVRQFDGVRVAQGILTRPISLPVDFFDHNPNQADRVSAVTLVGLDIQSAQQMRNYTALSGRFLQPTDTTACAITQSLADNLGLKAGDPLPLPTAIGEVKLTVTGILPARAIPGNEEVLVTWPEAQKLLEADGKISLIEINYNVTDQALRPGIEKSIESKLGSLYQYNALSDSSDLFTTLNLANALLNIFGYLSLFMGGFIIFNTFRTIVAERRRDIGLLRAVGANQRTIIGSILAEGLIQGTLGTLVGIKIGYLLALGAITVAAPILRSYINLNIGAPVVSPMLVLITAVSGVGITLLAGLLPAVTAGRVTPIEALRPSVANVDNRKSIGLSAIVALGLILLSLGALFSGNVSMVTAGALIFMLGLVFIAPALVRPISLAFGALFTQMMAKDGTGQLAAGNLNRQPTRAAVTASTTLIALAIIVVAGGLIGTIETGFLDVLKKSLGSDYLFMPPSVTMWANNVGANSRLAQQLKSVDGVGVLSTYRPAIAIADLKLITPSKGATVDKNGITVSLLGIDPVAFPQVSSLRFEHGSSKQAFSTLAAGRGLIINGVFASSAGLKVGDAVPFETSNGVQTYHVAAIANDFLDLKVVTGYISQANMASDFGKAEDVLIQLNLKPGADRAKVEAQLKAIKQAYPQFAMISGQAYYDQTVGLIKNAFAGMYVLFMFLAIPSLIAMLNTLAISVIERTREIGMLRAVGATRKQIRRMILAEALLLASIGTIFGLLAGLYLSYALIGAFKTAGFPVDFLFPWIGLLYATLVGLASGALASFIPSRQAARMDIIQALRYE